MPLKIQLVQMCLVVACVAFAAAFGAAAATQASDLGARQSYGHPNQITAPASTSMRDADGATSGPGLDPALRPLVVKAVGDLAAHLGIDPGQIEVLEAKAVVWPDSSLGCPQPGMAYKQVPEDGALILLRSGSHRYEYHSGGGRGLFLCDRVLQIKEKPVKVNRLQQKSPERRFGPSKTGP